MSALLRDYLPDISTLSVAQVWAIRQRLTDDLAANWPQLDTRPNSVAGDLNVTPTATLIAKAEAAVAMIMSDMDLTNVAAGKVYNPTFVTAFLANLGVTPLTSTYASGVVALTFSINQNYVIPSNTVFTFNGATFQISPGSGNPVVVYAYDASNPSSASNQWVLHQTDIGAFTVFLPVIGSAGASVSDGDNATSTLTLTQITSITAVGDFNSGNQPESLPQMAARAQQTFAAPNLMTRSGAISFLMRQWPQMVAAYVTITGDAEMLRAGTSPLGIVDGAMDVFVKSNIQYASGTANIPLVYDSTQGGWVGALSLPTFPAFYAISTGIFQTANFQNQQSLTQLYSRSTHPTTDSLAVSFSKWEQLGVFITDTTTTNFQPANISAVSVRSRNNIAATVNGEYCSNVFNSSVGRAVQIRLGVQVTWDGVNAIQATVTDTGNMDTGTVYFVPNSVNSPTGGVLATDSPDYKRLLNGLQISISEPGGVFNIADFAGALITFSFVGRSAYFTVNYLYDPSLVSVDSTLQNPDNRPIGVDVVTRCFMPCYISKFNINYRIGFGQSFDAATAQQSIFNYLNSLSGPDVYEESQVSQILLNAGASGLISIDKNCTFFPSLASTFVDGAGNATAVPRYPNSTLQLPANDSGITANTTTYIVSLNTITFNATVQ